MQNRRLVLPMMAAALAVSIATRAQNTGQIVVQLKPGTDITAFNRTYHTQLGACSPLSNSFCLAVAAGSSPDAVAASMASDSRVVAAGSNLVNQALDSTSTPPSTQWYVGTSGEGAGVYYTGQYSVAQVDYGTLSQRYTGSGVIVAIIDTGVSVRPDVLQHNVIGGFNFVDGNTNTDDVPIGSDANGNGIPDESAGHGTFVAGLVARFAPQATLLPVKVLNSDGTGTLWAAVEGIRYAVAHGARVLNLSFGSTQRSAYLNQAIEEASESGALVVTAAGNNNSAAPLYPAGNPLTLAVAGLAADNSKAWFSSYGADVDVDAPAIDVVSTYWDGRYALWSGTSFSAPMVSAEAALIFSAAPRWNQHQVRKLIIESSNSVNSVNPDYVSQLGKGSHGLIDMDAALSFFN